MQFKGNFVLSSAAANTYTGGTRLRKRHRPPDGGGRLLAGHGQRDVGEYSTLNLQGDNNLGSAATLNTQLFSTVNFTSAKSDRRQPDGPRLGGPGNR